jgi:hypothetical protein
LPATKFGGEAFSLSTCLTSETVGPTELGAVAFGDPVVPTSGGADEELSEKTNAITTERQISNKVTGRRIFLVFAEYAGAGGSIGMLFSDTSVVT